MPSTLQHILFRQLSCLHPDICPYGTSVIHKLNNCEFCCKRKVNGVLVKSCVDVLYIQEGANLPSEAQLVTNEGEAAAVLAAAAAEGLEAGSSPSEWRDNAAFARENHS